MNTKSILEKELLTIKDGLRQVESEKRNKINNLETEQCLPLIEKANAIKSEILISVNSEFKESIAIIKAKEKELIEKLDKINIESASGIWYNEGTIVYLWERERWGNNWKKTGKTGIVQIYNGTQELPNNINYYRLPKKGDVVVFYIKKDGTMGLKYDIIAEYGRLKNWFPMWLSEGENPTSNLLTINK